MVELPMAVPFVVLVAAAVAAMLGFRKTSVWVWFLAIAAAVYVAQGHITDALKISL